MVTTRTTLLLVLTLVLPACGGAVARGDGGATAVQPEPPPAAPRKTIAAPSQSAPAEAEPAAATRAEPAPAREGAANADSRPRLEKWTDLEASPGAAELEPGAAAVVAAQWVKARKQLGSALDKVRGTASLDATLAGQALLGRACAALGDTKAAEKAYGEVLATWKGAETARLVIEAAGSDEAARKQHLQRALLAVGEALFYSAEQKRKEAEGLRMPGYAGAGTRESVLKHINEKVASWMKEKQLLIEQAERAYLKIHELEPTPPPRWAVDSAARVGALWARFVAEFRAAPIPKEWHRSGPVPGMKDATYEEIRRNYYKEMDSASEPQRARARAAYQKCQADAAKFGYTDEFSRSCDVWLEKQPTSAGPR